MSYKTKHLRRKLKKNKTNRKSKRHNKNKNKRGGYLTEEIDLRQVLITKPIIQAINNYNPDLDLSEFKLSKGEQGFKLSRMEEMMNSNFQELLQNEPVELKIARTSEGKMIGTKIDGVMKKMYEIINGRHRITRAIIEGHKNINALIV